MKQSHNTIRYGRTIKSVLALGVGIALLGACERDTKGTASSSTTHTESKPVCEISQKGVDISNHLDTTQQSDWRGELGDADVLFGWVKDRNPVEINVAVGQMDTPEQKELASKLEREAFKDMDELAFELDKYPKYPRLVDEVESAEIPGLKAPANSSHPQGGAVLYFSAATNPDCIG